MGRGEGEGILAPPPPLLLLLVYLSACSFQCDALGGDEAEFGIGAAAALSVSAEPKYRVGQK